jgi:hypothetical protein
MENVVQGIGSGSVPAAPRRVGRSVAAVVAGLIAIVVTHTGADAIMHATGVFPRAGEVMSDALFGVALAYVTVRLAPARPMKHALVLGGIGTLLSLAGLLATLGRGPEFGPLWYPLALALASLPCCWLAATLASRHGSLVTPAHHTGG